jgi:hypothetical protein
VNIRLHGSKPECARVITALRHTPGLAIVAVRGPYLDRPPSTRVRVHLTVRPAGAPAHDPAEQPRSAPAGRSIPNPRRSPASSTEPAQEASSP